MRSIWAPLRYGPPKGIRSPTGSVPRIFRTSLLPSGFPGAMTAPFTPPAIAPL